MSAAVLTAPSIPQPVLAAEQPWVPRSVQEVFEALPEGTMAELIDDVIYMAPAPELPQQRTSLKLAVRLYNFIEETAKGGHCSSGIVFMIRLKKSWLWIVQSAGAVYTRRRAK